MSEKLEIEKKSSPLLWGGLLSLWLTAIYVGIFYARDMQRIVEGSIGREAFTYFVLATLAAMTIKVFFYLKNKASDLTTSLTKLDYLVFASVTAILAIRTLQLGSKAPEEAMHLVQYGMVYFLTLKTLLCFSNNSLMLFLALVLTSFFGALDEVIQWLAPERFFDWRDIALNIFSGAMVFLLFCFPLRPKQMKFAWGRKPLLSLALSSLALTSLLTLCLVNTPKNLASLRTFAPAFFNMFPHVGEMTEYGYRFGAEGAGEFKSRLSQDQLKNIDLKEGAKFAASLRSIGNQDYSSKLARYNAREYPWRHEVIVRVNRLENALSREDLLVVTKEKEILKEYFHSFFDNYFEQTDPVNNTFVDISSEDENYTSEVSKHLITLFSRDDVRSFYGVFFLIFTVVTILIFFKAG